MLKPSRRLLSMALFVLVGMAAAGSALAQQGSTLDAIIKRGKLLVGIDVGAPPFGFTDDQMQPSGADVETARLLASDLGVTLEVVPTTSANRIPYLLTSRVDLVMATFSILPERAKTVAFSTPYGAINSVIFAPQSVKITGPADLVGKKVGVARGTGNETSLARLAPQGTQIVRFDDEAGALTALATGQVDAYATGDTIAQSLNTRFPDKHFETKFIIQSAFYSVGLRHGDPDLQHWVDTCIFFHRQNGDLARIYQKFVGVKLTDLPTL
jgi:polar amino acid transport system substrate-binding protein